MKHCLCNSMPLNVVNEIVSVCPETRKSWNKTSFFYLGTKILRLFM